jgi:hypothetical protein
MRAIDMSRMEVVTMGLPWRHAVSPCSKQAISLLERNTKVVTWLMPKGGPPTEQLPCILYKDRYLLSMAVVPMFAVGLVFSFLSAWVCVRWLLRFISTHSFEVFAWYRIVFGLVVLGTGYSGLVVWTA